MSHICNDRDGVCEEDHCRCDDEQEELKALNPPPQAEGKERMKYENTIIQGDVLEVLKQMPDGFVDLVVTSPPYNVGINYGEDFNDEKEWSEYRETLLSWLKELHRVLKVGGRVCWNVPSFSSRQNLYKDSLFAFESAGFKQYAEIVWDKKQISSRLAWGSFMSASQPNILPRHEYILVFYKDEKNHGKGESTIRKEDFIKWTDGMWEFQPQTKSEHPAPFPEELPRRCIEMFSFKGDIILDPFMGSGTTALVAKNLGRKYLGIELNPAYIEIANKRLAQQQLFS